MVQWPLVFYRITLALLPAAAISYALVMGKHPSSLTTEFENSNPDAEIFLPHPFGSPHCRGICALLPFPCFGAIPLCALAFFLKQNCQREPRASNQLSKAQRSKIGPPGRASHSLPHIDLISGFILLSNAPS